MAKSSTAANNDIHLLLCECLRPRSHKHKPTKKFVLIRVIRGPFFLNRLALWLKSRYIHFPKTLFRGSKNLCNSFPPKKSVQICVICGKKKSLRKVSDFEDVSKGLRPYFPIIASPIHNPTLLNQIVKLNCCAQ